MALIMGVGSTHADKLTREPGFPVHVASFGSVRAWYRDDVEAHCATKPVPSRTVGELNDCLMTSAQVREPLGMQAEALIAAVHRREWHRVPEPSGRVSGTLYWLRDNFTRWLEEHPERRAENRIFKGNRTFLRPAKADQTQAK